MPREVYARLCLTVHICQASVKIRADMICTQVECSRLFTKQCVCRSWVSFRLAVSIMDSNDYRRSNARKHDLTMHCIIVTLQWTIICRTRLPCTLHNVHCFKFYHAVPTSWNTVTTEYMALPTSWTAFCTTDGPIVAFFFSGYGFQQTGVFFYNTLSLLTLSSTPDKLSLLHRLAAMMYIL